jgi:hypothetical protein
MKATAAMKATTPHTAAHHTAAATHTAAHHAATATHTAKLARILALRIHWN